MAALSSRPSVVVDAGPRPSFLRHLRARLRAADARGACSLGEQPRPRVVAAATAAEKPAPPPSRRRRSSLADDLRSGGGSAGRAETPAPRTQPSLPVFDDDDDDHDRDYERYYGDGDEDDEEAADADTAAPASSSSEVRFLRAARRVRTWEEAAMLAERGPSAVLLDGGEDDDGDWMASDVGADDDWAAVGDASSSAHRHHRTWSAVMLTAAAAAVLKLPVLHDDENELPIRSNSRAARQEAALRRREARRRGDALRGLQRCARRLLRLDALDAAAAANVLLSLTRARAVDPLRAIDEDEDDGDDDNSDNSSLLPRALLRSAAARADEFGPLETGALLAAARAALELRAQMRRDDDGGSPPSLEPLDATVGAVLGASATKVAAAAASSSSSSSSLEPLSRSLAALAGAERALSKLLGTSSARLGGEGRDAWVRAAAEAAAARLLPTAPLPPPPRALARLAASLAQLLLLPSSHSTLVASAAHALGAAAERAAPGMGPAEAAAVARALGLLAPPPPGPELYRRCARLMPAPPGYQSDSRRGRRARFSDAQALAVLVGLARAERAAERWRRNKGGEGAQGNGEESRVAALPDLVRRALWWAAGRPCAAAPGDARALAVAMATLLRAAARSDGGGATRAAPVVLRPDAAWVSRLREACLGESSHVSTTRRASKAVAHALGVLGEAADGGAA